MDKRVSLRSRLDERSQRAQGLQSNGKEMSGGGARQSQTSRSPSGEKCPSARARGPVAGSGRGSRATILVPQRRKRWRSGSEKVTHTKERRPGVHSFEALAELFTLTLICQD